MTKKILKFKGKIEKKEFKPDDQFAWTRQMMYLEGKEVEQTCEEYKEFKERSNKQNNYRHGVICQILSDFSGDTPLYWHKYLKIKFILKKIIGREPDMDKIILSGKFEQIAGMLTTTGQSTIEEEQINREIRAWASMELNVLIPLPQKVPYKY